MEVGIEDVSLYQSAYENFCTFADSAQPITEAALDIPLGLSPELSLKIRSIKPADWALTQRVEELRRFFLNTKPIDVYTAERQKGLQEPLISRGIFSDRDLIICGGDESDFALKRALFARESMEGEVKKVAYISSMLIGGLCLIHSGLFFGTLAGLSSFWLASAYSADPYYLDNFPEDREELIESLKTKHLTPYPAPSTFVELVHNTADYIFVQIPHQLRIEGIESYCVKPIELPPLEEEPEEVIEEAPVEEPIQKPVVEEATVEEPTQEPVIEEAPVEEPIQKPVVEESPPVPKKVQEEKAKAPEDPYAPSRRGRGRD